MTQSLNGSISSMEGKIAVNKITDRPSPPIRVNEI